MRIYIEGLDRTGKTTLKKELAKQTNYSHVILDRGPISNIAYNYLFKRPMSEENDEYEAKESFLNPIIVILYASEEEILRRMKNTNTENDEFHKDFDYEKNLNAFKFAQKYSQFKNFLWIDTTNISVDEEVQIIKEYIKKVKYENERIN